MWEPLGDKILILPDEGEHETESGLLIPDTAVDRPLRGKVIAVSESAKTPISVGDTVIYGRYGGSDLLIEGVTHVIMSVRDIYAREVNDG